VPAAARQGDPGVVDCAPFNIQTASSDVFVNNRGAARQGDSSIPHLWKKGKKCPPHSSTISSGSGSVFVNNRPFARVGDPFTQCTKIAAGSSDVFVGG
jgi:uncharacterized Zn-binding protein involved in type VI secretion